MKPASGLWFCLAIQDNCVVLFSSKGSQIHNYMWTWLPFEFWWLFDSRLAFGGHLEESERLQSGGSLFS